MAEFIVQRTENAQACAVRECEVEWLEGGNCLHKVYVI